MTLADAGVTSDSRPIATPDGMLGGTLHLPGTERPLPLLVCVHGSGCSGRYFELAHNSLVAEANRRGFAVLVIDRPGYGASAAPAGGTALAAGAAAIGALLDAVARVRPDLLRRPPALIGHSFGGAIALRFASAQPDGALAAVCVSGIGDRPDPAYAAARSDASAAAKPAPHWLFGPGNTYDWRGVTALRAAAAPWQPTEVREVVHDWPAAWATTVAAIRCPVQVRLAEFERIWEADAGAVARIAAAFVAVPEVDVAIAPDGGHLYEVHLRGRELVAAQLDFVAAKVSR